MTSREALNRVGRLWSKADINIVALAVLVVVISIVMRTRAPYFLSRLNIEVLLTGFVMEGIMALGLTLVIISGGIDLSVSSVLSFSAILTALLLKQGIPVGVSVVVVLLAASLIGEVNNELRRYLRVHPFIVTMAMMMAIQGLNLAITSGKVISGFSETFIALANGRVFGIPIPIVVFGIVAAIYATFLRHNRFFQQIVFLGCNEKAAILSGIRVQRVYRFVYVQSALLAGIAGILSASLYNSASPSFGVGVELKVITVAALGGSSLTEGGVGSIGGTVMAYLFLAMVYNAFVMSGISTYYQDVVTGLMLLIAVFVSTQLKSRTQL